MNIKSILSKTRGAMMGVAILMIIFYHANCCNLSLGVFDLPASYGLMGVDIFLLLSAYGLCYSLNSNAIKNFMSSRLARILPIYVILIVSILIYDVLHVGRVTAIDIFGASTTLFFWGLGDVFVDWYLTFLIYVYLSFPLLYRLVSRYGFLSVVVISLLALFSVWNLSLFWFQESAFCRVPIFLSGIYLYTTNNKRSALILLLALFVLLTVYSFISGNVCLTYYLAPFMICVIMLIVFFASKIRLIRKVLEFIGKHTLELYVANCMAMKFVNYGNALWQKYAVYFGLTFSIAIILYIIDYHIQKAISLRKPTLIRA